MGYAPLLSLIEPARAQGVRRLAVIGIPCQVYALRALSAQYGFESLWVIGTPCSDNTTTENFHRFLEKLTDQPDSVSYLEFRADYQVEMRFDDGRRRLIPFLQLPLSELPADFFPLTCRTCVDYVNALSDITVGYMGGQGQQWLIVRNEKGQQMLDLLGDAVLLSRPTDSGDRRSAVRGFIKNTQRAAGGLPLRRMPEWLRPLVGRLMTWFGPKGMEFARARIEMKAAETVIHLTRALPGRVKTMIPDHVRRIVGRLDGS
jgi:coenzyme F420 hydrogenase subunit beta